MDTFSLMFKVVYVQILFRNPIGSGVLDTGGATGAKKSLHRHFFLVVFPKRALLAIVREGYWMKWTLDMTQNGSSYKIILHPIAN